MKRALFDILLLVALAILVSYIGGLSRPYDAIGGEDMLALVFVVCAIRRLYVERKRAAAHKAHAAHVNVIVSR